MRKLIPFLFLVLLSACVPKRTPTPEPTVYYGIVATFPPGAMALCEDHTYSFSKTREGACSHHGGVYLWLK